MFSCCDLYFASLPGPVLEKALLAEYTHTQDSANWSKSVFPGLLLSFIAAACFQAS